MPSKMVSLMVLYLMVIALPQMADCLWANLNYTGWMSDKCHDPVRVHRPEIAAPHNETRIFDDFLWFISNGRVSKRDWHHFTAQHNLSEESGTDPNEYPIRKGITDEKPGWLPPSFKCLIFKADIALRFKYWTQNDTLEEVLFRMPTDAVYLDSKTCHSRKIFWQIKSNGISFGINFHRHVKPHLKVVGFMIVHFNSDIMKQSKRFNNFKQLDSNLEDSENCFRFAAIPEDHPFWCPMTQSFEKKLNGQTILSFNVSNILFDSMRNTTESNIKFRKQLTKPIREIFNCKKQWSPFLDNETNSWPELEPNAEPNVFHVRSKEPSNWSHSLIKVLNILNFYVFPVLLIILFVGLFIVHRVTRRPKP